MSQDALSGPDLDGVVADANAVGLDYVVIGGFSVIANGYLRATDDSDLLVPDGAPSDRRGCRGINAEVGGEQAGVAGLRSIVGFKRLAGRSRDRTDLEELEAFHGELPINPIPGLDS